MKYFVIVIIEFLFLHFSAVNSFDNDYELMWKNWKREFNKTYNSTELEQAARLNYLDNLAWIQKQPRNRSFRYGLNGFADQNRTEFDNTMNRAIVVESNFTAEETTQSPEKRKRRSAAPYSFDWRSQSQSKYLQPIQNQGQCGSCWAFSSTAVLESRTAIKNSAQSVGLSEQNLVDCVYNSPTDGCNGGWPVDAFQWIQKSAGQEIRSEYKYTSGGSKHSGTCQYDATKPHSSLPITGCSQASPTEQQLMELICDGPVAAAMDASNLQLYDRGIYKCENFLGVNHAVVLVGYGTDTGTNNKKENYWIVRNSWGSGWGEKGYFRVTRNSTTDCGATMYIMFPTL